MQGHLLGTGDVTCRPLTLSLAERGCFGRGQAGWKTPAAEHMQLQVLGHLG
jgi:hypothetical protein